MSRAATDWLIAAAPLAAVAALLMVAVIWRPKPAFLTRPGVVSAATAAAQLLVAGLLATTGRWWLAAFFLVLAVVAAVDRLRWL